MSRYIENQIIELHGPRNLIVKKYPLDIGNLKDTQNSYERIRKPRVKMITRLSKEQALHNHISNPLLKKTRNFLMSKTPIIDKQMDRIYKFEL